MLKAFALTGILGIGLAATGCSSYVKTYDANDNLLGACRSGTTIFGVPFLPFGSGSCGGSANRTDQGDAQRAPSSDSKLKSSAYKKTPTRADDAGEIQPYRVEKRPANADDANYVQ